MLSPVPSAAVHALYTLPRRQSGAGCLCAPAAVAEVLRFVHKCQKRASIEGKRPGIEAKETLLLLAYLRLALLAGYRVPLLQWKPAAFRCHGPALNAVKAGFCAPAGHAFALYVYMYMYMYMYIYIHTYIPRSRTRTYIQTYIHIYIPSNPHIHTYIHTYISRSRTRSPVGSSQQVCVCVR